MNKFTRRILAFTSLLLVTQTVLAAEDLTCPNLEKFGNGEYDYQSSIFGFKTATWDNAASQAVISAARTCETALKKLLSDNGNLNHQTSQQVTNVTFKIIKKTLFLEGEVDRQRKIDRRTESYAKEKQQDEKKQFIAAQKQKEAECHATAEYDAFDTQESIINARESLQYTQNRIRQQEKYEKASGVIDLYARRSLGMKLVEDKEWLAESWSYYKKHGGKAKSPQAFQREIQNPCAEITASIREAEQK